MSCFIKPLHAADYTDKPCYFFTDIQRKAQNPRLHEDGTQVSWQQKTYLCVSEKWVAIGDADPQLAASRIENNGATAVQERKDGLSLAERRKQQLGSEVDENEIRRRARSVDASIAGANNALNASQSRIESNLQRMTAINEEVQRRERERKEKEEEERRLAIQKRVQEIEDARQRSIAAAEQANRDFRERQAEEERQRKEQLAEQREQQQRTEREARQKELNENKALSRVCNSGGKGGVMLANGQNVTQNVISKADGSIIGQVVLRYSHDLVTNKAVITLAATNTTSKCSFRFNYSVQKAPGAFEVMVSRMTDYVQPNSYWSGSVDFSTRYQKVYVDYFYGFGLMSIEK